MTIRFATPDEINTWDEHILTNADAGNIFQGYAFALQKQTSGWKPRFIMLGDTAITMLERSIPGLGKFWYAPKGPGAIDTTELGVILPKLQEFASSHGAFAIKIEPELIDTAKIQAELHRLGLLPVAPIQPNYATVNVNLNEPIGDILAHFNQKGRHAVNRAIRDGVTVQLVDTTDTNCQIMYRLLADTARQSFRIRSYGYYRSFWQRYASRGDGQLFFAYVDNEIVAGAFAVTYGTKSTYKDGASIRARTVYGASHLLQWHVMQWAKAQGSLVHDLCGTPPSADIKNTDHAYYGLGRFKTSFNKQVTDYVGAFDVVIKPRSYKIWSRCGERIVRKLHSVRHHENWY